MSSDGSQTWLEERGGQGDEVGQERGPGGAEGRGSGNAGSRAWRPVRWRDGAHIPLWVIMPGSRALT